MMTVNGSSACWQLNLPLENLILANLTAFLVSDIIVAILTIFGNSIFLYTLMNYNTLRTPSNILLGALCVSDLLVGVVTQPLYLTFLSIMRFKEIINKALITAVTTAFLYCGGLSFTYIGLISFDRYLAICKPYRYVSQATCKTHLIAAVTGGAVWAILIILEYFYTMSSAFQMCLIGYGSLIIMSIIFSYANIYIVILKQKRTIVHLGTISEQPTQNTFTSVGRRRIKENKKQERDKTWTITIMMLLFFICYMPYFGRIVYYTSRNKQCWDDSTLFLVTTWSNFIILLNSCMNVAVYCARSKDIRNAALNTILCKSQRLYVVGNKATSASVVNTHCRSCDCSHGDTNHVHIRGGKSDVSGSEQ